MMSELLEIKNQFEELQKKYQDYLPKVDPDLIYDLLVRQREDPITTPMYMVEVFIKRGIDSQKIREYILKKTGMVPAIYDNGTHYVTNQKLTIDMLKDLSDSNDVLEVSGEYTGGDGGLGASHEQRNHRYNHDYYISSSGEQEHEKKPRSLTESAPIEEHKSRNNHKSLRYTLLGIVGAIALAGFIISGGLLPNINNAASLASSPSSLPSVLGAVQGYVGGPGGLPAIGTTIIAHKIQVLPGTDQRSPDYTTNSIISIDGKYSLDLPPGVYTFTVAFPDGTNQIVSSYAVWPQSSHILDFKY